MKLRLIIGIICLVVTLIVLAYDFTNNPITFYSIIPALISAVFLRIVGIPNPYDRDNYFT